MFGCPKYRIYNLSHVHRLGRFRSRWQRIRSRNLKYFTRIPLLILLSGALFVEPASAAQPMSVEERAMHCRHYQNDPEGKDGIFCVRYIQGFIDGAMATDERVALNVAAEYQEEETFTQRAIRTRLSNRLLQYGSYYAEFCLGGPVTLAEVVGRVTEDLGEGVIDGESMSARDLVYQTLRKHYPCTR